VEAVAALRQHSDQEMLLHNTLHTEWKVTKNII
jgi:hypothetical protein